jgi:hypothetical protein
MDRNCLTSAHSGGTVEALPLAGRDGDFVLVHDAWLPFRENIRQ